MKKTAILALGLVTLLLSGCSGKGTIITYKPGDAGYWY